MCELGAGCNGGAQAAVEQHEGGMVRMGREQGAAVAAWAYGRRRGVERWSGSIWGERERVRLTQGAHGRLWKRLDVQAREP